MHFGALLKVYRNKELSTIDEGVSFSPSFLSADILKNQINCWGSYEEASCFFLPCEIY